jgi:hypothetical protein
MLMGRARQSGEDSSLALTWTFATFLSRASGYRHGVPRRVNSRDRRQRELRSSPERQDSQGRKRSLYCLCHIYATFRLATGANVY